MIETKFKDTEVGKIPVDWESNKLGANASIFRGGSPRPIEAYLTTDSDGVNWIKIGDVKPNDKYIRHTAEKIIKAGVSRSRVVTKGDFILSNSMSFGRPYILDLDGCIHDGWLVIRNYHAKYDMSFLYYMLSSENVFEQYIAMAAGSSVKNLNKEKVADVIISAPTDLDEQQRIAEALSNIDSLIENLDKLIEKKRLIKQGAMQKLLTGKKRLPGFTGEWGNQNITTLCTIKARIGWQGLTTNEYLPVGDYILVTGTDFKNGYIDWKSCYYVSEWRYQQDHNIQIRNGDILITKDGTIGKVAYIENLPKEGTLNSGVFVIRTKDDKKLDNAYLSWFFKSKWFVDFINQLSAGSTINHLYQKDFTKLNIIFPTSVDEQRAIALILSSMDTNIDVLEQKRDKYIAIKKGMMQQLLTGKIRLI